MSRQRLSPRQSGSGTGAPFVFLLALCGVANAADVQLRHVDVFQSGTQGYHTFRIPAIAVTGDGTLLAFAEGRVNNASDPGTGNPIDTVVKRSTDGGQTWSALEVLAPGGVEIAAFQPTTVVDRTDGMNRVWVFYNYRNPNPPPGRENDKGLFARYSDDNGLTWSTPRSYEHLRPPGATNFTANIASGVQMASGRLVIPMKTDFLGTESQPSVLTSDDHGATWALGGLTPPGTNEHQIVELAGGSLLSNQRPNSGTVRRISISINGGLSWSTNINGPNLTPVSTGIERYTLAGVNGEDTKLLTQSADTSANGGSGEFLDVHFLDSNATSHFDFGVSSSEQFRIRGLGTTQTTAAGAMERGKTYFLVAKIVSQDGSNEANFDQAFLKVYESGDAIPATDDAVAWTLVGTTDENDDAVLDRLRISGGASATWSLDELHVGMDFASVVLGPPPLGDLNGDRVINLADWLVFRGNMNLDTSTDLPPDRPTLGDFDQNGHVDPVDFTEFVGIYDDANGAGAFQSLLSVPEPAHSVLMLVGLTCLVGWQHGIGLPATRRQ